MPTPETRATRSGLLDAGRLGNNACQRADVTGPPPCLFGSGVCQPPFTPPASRRFIQRFLASAEVAGLERSATRVGNRHPFLHRLRTSEVANSDARCIVLIPLFMYGSLREQSLALLRAHPNACGEPHPTAFAPASLRLLGVGSTAMLGCGYPVGYGWDAPCLAHPRAPALAYWITSSAWIRSVGGNVIPRAFAVLRLSTSSNFAGCSTGRSPGFAPFRILSTKMAARRHISRIFGA